MVDVNGSLEKLRERYGRPGEDAGVKRVVAALAASHKLDHPSKLTGATLARITAEDIRKLPASAVDKAADSADAVTPEQAATILVRFLGAMSLDLAASRRSEEAYVVSLFADELEGEAAGAPESAGTREAIAALFPKP